MLDTRSPVMPHIHWANMGLAIDAERPLSELHDAAKRCGISKRMFRPGSVPYYKVTHRMFDRVCEALGYNGCPCGDAVMREVLPRCYRPSEVVEFPG